MALQLDRRAFFHLSLLLLVVPIQYYLVKQSPSSEAKKLEGLNRIWFFCQNAYNQVLTLWPIKGISGLISQFLKTFSGASKEENSAPDEGESPALEILKKKYAWSSSGHFASSLEPRYPRPTNVKYRIGQIVKHLKWGYRGVIIGWDSQTRAPASWIKENHEGNKQWSSQPNYAVLIDIRDRTIPQLSYVPEENIELAPSSVRITHPGMEDFFEAFDGAQYLPRPWLKTLYPMDA